MSQMESQDITFRYGPVVHISKAEGAPLALVVCEHASNRVPEFLGDMGLSPDALQSHIAWDPGALPVAQALSQHLSAPLVHGGISRLVYDCNRPPEASDAMPTRSEDITIPANANLTPAQRAERVAHIYRPFETALSDEIARHQDTLQLMVTIHSFTPVYRGRHRAVELGLLHGTDDLFAKAMMASAPDSLSFETQLNEPYSAADGVAHTLDVQAVPNGLLNVMIEIRNDLIQTWSQQQAMADLLAPWIAQTLSDLCERGRA